MIQEISHGEPKIDQSDFALIRHVCNDCAKFFFTKAKINVSYSDMEDIILSNEEAHFYGII